jgi:Response regulators consisting of a CheY-like receiver domain and a winged-helix DNA-binding domain
MFLVVEDDDDEFFLVDRALKQGNDCPALLRAADGAEAIEYLAGDGKYSDRQNFPLPNLLLLDIKMPRKNGFEVLQWVRTHPGLQRIPVIMLSSSQEPEDIERAYALGANSFITKPSYEVFSKMATTIKEFWLNWNIYPENEKRPSV